MAYRDIVYATYEDSDETVQAFLDGEMMPGQSDDDHEHDYIAAHLSQWDMDCEGEVREKAPWGTSDYVHEVSVPYAGDYILTYNLGLGYVALCQRVEG